MKFKVKEDTAFMVSEKDEKFKISLLAGELIEISENNKGVAITVEKDGEFTNDEDYNFIIENEQFETKKQYLEEQDDEVYIGDELFGNIIESKNGFVKIKVTEKYIDSEKDEIMFTEAELDKITELDSIEDWHSIFEFDENVLESYTSVLSNSLKVKLEESFKENEDNISIDSELLESIEDEVTKESLSKYLVETEIDEDDEVFEFVDEDELIETVTDIVKQIQEKKDDDDDDDDDDDLDEVSHLTASQKRDAAKYRKSAEGKKAAKKTARKMSKASYKPDKKRSKAAKKSAKFRRESFELAEELYDRVDTEMSFFEFVEDIQERMFDKAFESFLESDDEIEETEDINESEFMVAIQNQIKKGKSITDAINIAGKELKKSKDEMKQLKDLMNN